MVIGEIVEITQNENALDEFFLIAPELSKLLGEFAAEYGSDNDKIPQHHEFTGRKLYRMMKNARKLTDVFREHGDPLYISKRSVDCCKD